MYVFPPNFALPHFPSDFCAFTRCLFSHQREHQVEEDCHWSLEEMQQAVQADALSRCHAEPCRSLVMPTQDC